MIVGMDEQPERKETLLQRWKQGQFANRSVASTVSLSIVLVATLLWAKAIVVSRSGPLYARDNGRELTEAVGTNGLGYYLDQYDRQAYYLLEENGRPVGFGALVTEPLNQQGQLVIAGKELIVHLEAYREFSQFVVADDLSHYRYKKVYQNPNGKIVKVIEQTFHDNLLSGKALDSTGRSLSVPPYQVEPFAMIPPFLLDLFSSLGMQERYSDGIVLVYPNEDLMQTQRGGPVMFQTEQFWVQPLEAGVIPGEVMAQYPQGLGCRVQALGSEQQEQIFYFDGRNQLVWQKLPVNGSEYIYRAVPRDDLLQTFTDAEVLLEQLFRNEKTEDELELL